MINVKRLNPKEYRSLLFPIMPNFVAEYELNQLAKDIKQPLLIQEFGYEPVLMKTDNLENLMELFIAAEKYRKDK